MKVLWLILFLWGEVFCLYKNDQQREGIKGDVFATRKTAYAIRYDEKGLPHREKQSALYSFYNEQGMIDFTFSVRYPPNGERSSGVFLYRLYKYDGSSRAIDTLEMVYKGDQLKIFEEESTYNDEGNLTDLVEKDETGNPVSESHYEYRGDLLLSETHYDDAQEKKNLVEYGYLDDGRCNFVKKGWIDGKGIKYFVSEIDYEYMGKQPQVLYDRLVSEYLLKEGVKKKQKEYREFVKRRGKVESRYIVGGGKPVAATRYSFNHYLDEKENPVKIESYEGKKLTQVDEFYYFYKGDEKVAEEALDLERRNAVVLGPESLEAAQKIFDKYKEIFKW